MKYQYNPLLLEDATGKITTIATPVVLGSLGAGAGALGGHIASKFGGSDLSDEEKKERSKKFRRRGALVGGTAGLGFAAHNMAGNKVRRAVTKFAWTGDSSDIDGLKNAMFRAAGNNPKLLAKAKAYSDNLDQFTDKIINFVMKHT